jgi:hypothetical protein
VLFAVAPGVFGGDFGDGGAGGGAGGGSVDECLFAA